MPYRILTVLFLTLFFAPFWIPTTAQPVKVTQPSPDGAITFDPCYMWEQMPISTKVAALLFLTGLFTVVVYGLFNRRAPWWTALAFSAGWLWTLERQSPYIQSCGNTRDWQIAAPQTAIVLIWSACHLRSPRPI